MQSPGLPGARRDQDIAIFVLWKAVRMRSNRRDTKGLVAIGDTGKSGYC